MRFPETAKNSTGLATKLWAGATVVEGLRHEEGTYDRT